MAIVVSQDTATFINECCAARENGAIFIMSWNESSLVKMVENIRAHQWKERANPPVWIKDGKTSDGIKEGIMEYLNRAGGTLFGTTAIGDLSFRQLLKICELVSKVDRNPFLQTFASEVAGPLATAAFVHGEGGKIEAFDRVGWEGFKKLIK